VSRIVVLEDDPDLRELLCILLRRGGADECLAFTSVEELQQHPEAVLGSTLALLDVNLGPGLLSGVDAFHWLKQHGFVGDVVFLTGHASFNPLVKEAFSLPNVRVLEKPVDARRIQALVQGEGRKR